MIPSTHRFAVFITLVVAATCPAQTLTWNGSVSTDWTTPGNWTPAGPPTTATPVVVPAAPTGGRFPSTVGVVSPTCGGVTIQAGASLMLDATTPLFVNGGGSVNGTVGGPGALSFTGASPSAFSIRGVVPVGVDVEVTGTGSYSIAGQFDRIFHRPLAGELQQSAELTVGTLLKLEGTRFTGVSGVLQVTNVEFATSNAVTSPGLIGCSGSWTSNNMFQPAGGVVAFNGSGIQSVQVAVGTEWATLQVLVGSTISLSGDLVVKGNLLVAGTLNLTTASRVELRKAANLIGTLSAPTAATLSVLWDPLFGSTLTVGATGTLSMPGATADIDGALSVVGTCVLGGGVHRFSQYFALPATFAVPPNTTLRVEGTRPGAQAVGPAVPGLLTGNANVEITSTESCILHGGFAGSVFHRPGAGDLRHSSNVTVGSLLRLEGNSYLEGGGTLQVNNIEFRTFDTVIAPGDIVCSGSWFSNDKFQPQSGAVTFNGGIVQSVQVAPNTQWQTLNVTSGTTVGLLGDLTVRGNLVVSGTLNVTGAAPVVETRADVNVTGVLRALTARELRALWHPVYGSTVVVDTTGTLDMPMATANVDGTLRVLGNCTLGNAAPHRISSVLALQGNVIVQGGTVFQMTGMRGNTALIQGPSVGGPLLPANATIEITSPIPCVIGGGFAGDVLHGPMAGELLYGGHLTVGNLFQVQGSWFNYSGGGATLSVKDMRILPSGTRAVTAPGDNILCSGNLTANARLQAGSGTVAMTGSAQSISANGGCFNNLTIRSGSVVTLTTATCINSNLTVEGGGRLNNPVTASVGRDCTNAGTMDFVDLGTIEVGQDLTNSGGTYLRTGGTSSLAMTGTGTLQSSVSQLASLQIRAGVGHVTVVGNVPLAADFTMSSGTLGMGGPSSILVVGRNALLEGGTIEGGVGNTGLIDVAGNVTFAGTTAPVPPLIRCAGNWTADLNFSPNSGVVELIGTATTAIVASANPPEVRFHQLVLRNGVREPAPGLILRAPLVTVESTGTLRATGSGFSCRGTQLNVLGRLEILAGARLGLDPASILTVEPGGTLAMLGTPVSLAQLGDSQGTGFGVEVRGRAEMANFLVEGMNASGVRLRSTATFGTPPLDFRAGTLRRGSASPGAVLLNVERTTPLELRYLTFDNTPPTATFNVRSLTTGPIRMVNASGVFAGPNFEDDPNQVIDWVSANTRLRSFTATGRLGHIALAFATTAEEDVRAFKVMRGPTVMGPFADIASFPPQGGPSLPASYGTQDQAVVFPTRYFYRLEEELLHGARSLLASDSARPLPPSVGRMAAVGSGGFASIPAAMAAVGPGGFVVVAQGTYPAFAINQPVHLLGDGSGPVVIDTSAGPLQIANVPFAPGTDVTLYDLSVGSATSPFGVDVVNCGCPVVLDHLTVTVNATSHGVLVDQSPGVSFPPKGVVLQSCTLTGGPGLRVRNGSAAYLAAGTIDRMVVENTSRVTRAATTLGSFSVDGTSSDTPLAGTMPRLEFPLLAGTEKTTQLTLRGDPASVYLLYLAFTKDLLDLSLLVPVDMPLLLNPLELLPLASGVNLTGNVELGLPIPAGMDLWGNALPLQFVAFPPSFLGRWSNVRDLLIVP